MARTIKFRAWTGKRMLYQDQQYLASFIRRTVPRIIVDNGGERYSEHESYLPNGGVIDEYLTQWTGLLDKNIPRKEIYENDIVDENGKVIGNLYENSPLLEKGTYLLIQGFRTKTWCATYQEAVDRGCIDSE